MAGVRYPGDVLCQIDVGWSTPFARNGLEVNGTTGSLIATDVMRGDPGGSVLLANAQGRHELAFERPPGRLTLTLAIAQAGRSGAVVPISPE